MVTNMKKIKSAFLFLGLASLAGCSTTNVKPPRNQANACAIFDEKGKWEKPTFQAAYDWGVSPGTILSFIKHESSFRHDARPVDKNGKAISSAYGYSQALNGTWSDYEKARGNSKRKKYDDSADFIGWYIDRIAKLTGLDKSDTKNLYLAFHEGPGGFKRGSYNNKTWLINYADRVQSQAQIYDNQLYRCEKGKMNKFNRLALK